MQEQWDRESRICRLLLIPNSVSTSHTFLQLMKGGHVGALSMIPAQFRIGSPMLVEIRSPSFGTHPWRTLIFAVENSIPNTMQSSSRTNRVLQSLTATAPVPCHPNTLADLGLKA